MNMYTHVITPWAQQVTQWDSAKDIQPPVRKWLVCAVRSYW